MPCNQQPDTHSLSDPTTRDYHTILKITVPLTRLIRHCWGRICHTGQGGGSMHPSDMQKQLQWVWHTFCTFSVWKVGLILIWRGLLFLDQGCGRICLFRWYSTNHQSCNTQEMLRCKLQLKWARTDVEQVILVWWNVTIISKEYPLHNNTLMKRWNMEGGKPTMHRQHNTIERASE